MPSFTRSLAALFFVLSGTGCSLVVNPESAPVRCNVSSGRDFCPFPSRCVSGVCQAVRVDAGLDAGDGQVPEDAPFDNYIPVPDGCVDSMELCNQLDDDCDGIPDEDFDFDLDRHLDRARCGGEFATDCNDHDAFIHPGVIDWCNGADDNCDGATDENGSATCAEALGLICVDAMCVDLEDCTRAPEMCLAGEACNSTTRRCEPLPCEAAGAPECTDGKRCDPTTGMCITPRRDGEACTHNGQCESGSCYPANALLPGSVCSRACCSDDTCAADALCVDTGTGARGCLPFASIGLTAGGSADALGVCDPMSATNECRSAACMPDGKCFDPCVGAYTLGVPLNVGCPTGTTCQLATLDRRLGGLLGTLPGFNALACRPTGTAAGDIATGCTMSADCKSNICLSSVDLCTTGCRVQSDCVAGWHCGTIIRASTSGGGRRDHIQVCVPNATGDLRALNAPCSMSSQCQSGACVNLRCADTCCTSASCGTGAQCRPVLRTDAFEMRCAVGG